MKSKAKMKYVNDELIGIVNKIHKKKKIKIKKKTYHAIISCFIISLSIIISIIIIFFLNRKTKKNVESFDVNDGNFLTKTINKQNYNNLNLEDIFKSRQLFIDDFNLTNEYIHYIRPINEDEEKNYKKKLYENVKPTQFWKEKRPNQYTFEDYYKLIKEEKLIINVTNLNTTDTPLVSVIISSFNK